MASAKTDGMAVQRKAGRNWLRWVPNIISAARLAATPVLLFLAFAHKEQAFGWLMVAALVSDVVDGLIARSFGLMSRLGARLDSTADALLFPVAAYGVWTFHPGVVTEHGLAFGAVVGLTLLEYAASFWRYGRLSSFHTYLSRIAAYGLGIFLGVLFVFGFVTWLMWFAVIAWIVASLEEFVLLWRLPEWRSDVKGLWWVLGKRTTTALPETR